MNFNRYKNTLNKTLTNVKRVYYNAIFNLYKHDIKKPWGVISENSNRKVKIHSQKQWLLVCSSREIIVEKFNTFLLVLEKRMNTTFTHMKGHTLEIILTNDIKCNFAFHLKDNNATIRIIKIQKFQVVKA